MAEAYKSEIPRNRFQTNDISNDSSQFDLRSKNLSITEEKERAIQNYSMKKTRHSQQLLAWLSRVREYKIDPKRVFVSLILYSLIHLVSYARQPHNTIYEKMLIILSNVAIIIVGAILLFKKQIQMKQPKSTPLFFVVMAALVVLIVLSFPLCENLTPVSGLGIIRAALIIVILLREEYLSKPILTYLSDIGLSLAVLSLTGLVREDSRICHLISVSVGILTALFIAFMNHLQKYQVDEPVKHLENQVHYLESQLEAVNFLRGLPSYVMQVTQSSSTQAYSQNDLNLEFRDLRVSKINRSSVVSFLEWTEGTHLDNLNLTQSENTHSDTPKSGEKLLNDLEICLERLIVTQNSNIYTEDSHRKPGNFQSSEQRYLLHEHILKMIEEKGIITFLEIWDILSKEFFSSKSFGITINKLSRKDGRSRELMTVRIFSDISQGSNERLLSLRFSSERTDSCPFQEFNPLVDSTPTNNEMISPLVVSPAFRKPILKHSSSSLGINSNHAIELNDEVITTQAKVDSTNVKEPKWYRIKEIDYSKHFVSSGVIDSPQGRAERLNVLEEAMSVVVHDMRSPLMCIQGNLELIDFELRTSVYYDLISPLIKSSISALTLLSFLVSDILDSARISKGIFQICDESMDLEETIRDCLETVRIAAKSKNNSLNYRYSGEKIILSDRQRIKQVILNFLSNSIKFTKDGVIRVLVTDLPESKLITVEDNGEGIKKEHVAKMFEKFSADRNVRSNAKGIGLGLFICKSIVETLGPKKEIEVSSELGKGTKITFEIYKDVRKQKLAEKSPSEVRSKLRSECATIQPITSPKFGIIGKRRKSIDIFELNNQGVLDSKRQIEVRRRSASGFRKVAARRRRNFTFMESPPLINLPHEQDEMMEMQKAEIPSIEGGWSLRGSQGTNSFLNILIVEDDPFIMDVYKAFAEQISRQESITLDIYETSTIFEANSMIDQVNIDVVVTDCNLPDGTGLDFVKDFSVKHHDRSRPLFILATGEDPNGAAIQQFSNLFFEILSKPVSINAFTSAIVRCSQIQRDRNLPE